MVGSLLESERKLIIVGCGDFCREALEWAFHEINSTKPTLYNKVSIIGDPPDFVRYPRLRDLYEGSIEKYAPNSDDRFVIAIADPCIREKIASELRLKGAKFGKIVHPSVIVSHSSTVNEGVILAPNVVITTDVIVGRHVHINIASTLGHDVRIKNFVTLSSHVDITGHCILNEKVFLGSGARILPKCEIAAGSRIGAGSVVMRSIKEKTTVISPKPKLVVFK